MFDTYKRFAAKRGQNPPCLKETIAAIKADAKPSVHSLLANAQRTGRVLVQPRCGVGCPTEMTELLRYLETNSDPDILSLTIDAHTRLLRFEVLDRVVETAPQNLNGYPLLSHGWEKTRALNKAVSTPIEVRHGSPDGRLLFAAAIASGITSYEGGGIGYNIPYCKKVPLDSSLHYWQEVDAFAGELGASGVSVDREFFGTLTAVLIPPGISIAMSLLEAFLAAREGVRCLSIAYCQGGHVAQDVAALRAIKSLGERYLPEGVDVFPVLHQFMGAFPERPLPANSLIALGALTAKMGGATKMINKTSEEALGVPVPKVNAKGIQLSQLFNGRGFDSIPIDEGRVSEEQAWIETEVAELISPILAQSDPIAAICAAFEKGTLDVPFSASMYARSDVLPARDRDGAIRILRPGALPFSHATKARHIRQLERKTASAGTSDFHKLRDDILYFAKDVAPELHDHT
ncbi:glutamate mutase subunit E [Roseibium hamelinense]|uniref:Glutamate mutase subunit E n=1 Tax=Roseibium hamelinense TaxID=150831 RepID=A0A562TGE3_9HYPH|nr:methylaspartate mutase [Roseibium hamelinense]MTI46148.1 methylaspartate mutase [Roseibium hamelinense]TWI92659.1 glutamate mutase subunit E [Roseibium hamelinense]